MALASDLLKDAHHLAQRGGQRPTQASLRRAVSTASYALFHLLISDFAANWKVTDQRHKLARILDHGKMKNAWIKVVDSQKKLSSPTDLEAKLGIVAASFLNLQQDRNDADDNNGKICSRSSVIKSLKRATDAFAAWQDVRKSAAAQDYLISMLGRRQS